MDKIENRNILLQEMLYSTYQDFKIYLKKCIF